jgi:polysaccharide transporter, PST family
MAGMNNYFGEDVGKEGLGRQSLRSGAFAMAARVINAATQIGSVLFLARLLTPEDYGLVAMVTALTGFAPVLCDLGTRDAVVQRVRVTEGEVSALFWMTMGLGCALAVIIGAASPLIARFYGEPRLIAIVLVSSLTFVVTALANQHQALLRRAVMFRELAIVEVVANLVSAAGAIAMAYQGLEYWALVTRPVAMQSLNTAGVWLYCRWLPGRPTVTPGVKQMVKFGLNLSGFSATDFVGKNCDRVAVGRGLGASMLGYYQNATFMYDNVLDVLVIPLHQVAVASLSKLQNDREQLRRAWSKALSTVAFYAMPAFGILAITSQDLVVVVLGDKWAQAGALLTILALRGIPHCVERTLGWLHVAAGRPDRWMRWGALAAVGQLVALFCGLPFGPFGVVTAYVVVMYIAFVPAIAYAGAPLGIGARDVIATVHAQLIAALGTAAVGFAVRFTLLAAVPSIERMAILVVLYLTIYLLVVVGLFRVTTPIEVCLSVVRGFLPGSLKPNAALIVPEPGK